MEIVCIERVIIAVKNLVDARENWRKAGFGLARGIPQVGGLRWTRLAAGAVAIDLCAIDGERRKSGMLREAVESKLAQGGGIVGWVWGARGSDRERQRQERLALPAWSDAESEALVMRDGLSGVSTAKLEVESDAGTRRARLLAECGHNANTVDYLEHIVLMVGVLDDAIRANEAISVPCKRIRDAGRGMRQAFFKLEQTVLEVVGPSERAGGWGLAFMCRDIASAVAIGRKAGLQVTEPKVAIQGGKICRIVEPLDGVALAYMEPAAT